MDLLAAHYAHITLPCVQLRLARVSATPWHLAPLLQAPADTARPPPAFPPAENDPRLDEADRALARFQAQRLREARKAASSGTGAAPAARQLQLTHGGRSLEELEALAAAPPDALEQLDDDLLEELVAQYHFGGGGSELGGNDQLGGSGGATDDGDAPAAVRKTKKQVRSWLLLVAPRFTAWKRRSGGAV